MTRNSKEINTFYINIKCFFLICRALGIEVPVSPPYLTPSNFMSFIDDLCVICRDVKTIVDQWWNTGFIHRFYLEYYKSKNGDLLQKCPTCGCSSAAVFFYFANVLRGYQAEMLTIRSHTEICKEH